MQGSNNDKQRKHRMATSKAMYRSAQARKCPKCGRMNALKRTEDAMGMLRMCRWCDYEQFTMWPI